MKAPAIVGFGWVGKATSRLFPSAPVCDPMANPENSITISEINSQCDSAIICVPTPWNSTKKRLDTSVVAGLIEQLQVPLVLIRSTLNVGDGDLLMKEGLEIVIWPEYIGQTHKHPFQAGDQPPFVVLGGSHHGHRLAISLLQKCFNANIRLRLVDRRTAEVIKLSENRAIAWKVHECQELCDACEAAGIDYYSVREAVFGDDPRFNLWWTFVYEDSRGFQSKCVPKDVQAWAAWAESVGTLPEVTLAILEANSRLTDSQPS